MECFKGWTASETIINPVPGVSTEGGAADWVPILGGVILHVYVNTYSRVLTAHQTSFFTLKNFLLLPPKP